MFLLINLIDDLRFRTTEFCCQIMDGQIAAFFFGVSKVLRLIDIFSRDTQTVKAIFNRYSTIYDSILVARLGLWFGLGLGLV